MLDRYEIRKALLSDWEALKSFLHEHWRPNHIFTTHQAIFDWQHKDQNSGNYNFILGIDKESGQLHGALGFIRLSQYDPDHIDPRKLIWMAIWKVCEDAKGHRLGRYIQTYLTELEKPEIISSVAASAMTLSMYRELGYQVGSMRQHFILNPDKNKFALASIPDNFSIDGLAQPTTRSLELITQSELLTGTNKCFENQKAIPVKTPGYIAGRYLNHPIYEYDIYKIVDAGIVLGLIVTRTCDDGKGHKAVRIVEFVGPDAALEGLARSLQDLVKRHDAEYVDFYCAGVDLTCLIAAGFRSRDEHNEVILPNHFEPFVRKNVPIDFMISTPLGQPFRILKGDSDQDRPNINPESHNA